MAQLAVMMCIVWVTLHVDVAALCTAHTIELEVLLQTCNVSSQNIL